MNRRRLLAALPFAPVPMNALALDENYAESVAMTAYAMNTQTSFDVRIARFPSQNRGSLWVYVFADRRHASLADDNVRLLDQQVVDVSQPDARFSVEGATLRGFERDTENMRGHLSVRARARGGPHPVPGRGGVPVSVRADFTASHAPVMVRPGRIEVMGSVAASISIDGNVRTLTMPGKWHEQTGVRLAFAPAFTYLFVQGPGRGIMTTRHARGAWGYVFRNDSVVKVVAAEIDPYGSRERIIEVVLEDGERIRGTARVVREVSVPIEGQRRPGATVRVESDIGRMVGVLNDWQPE